MKPQDHNLCWWAHLFSLCYGTLIALNRWTGCNSYSQEILQQVVHYSLFHCLLPLYICGQLREYKSAKLLQVPYSNKIFIVNRYWAVLAIILILELRVFIFSIFNDVTNAVFYFKYSTMNNSINALQIANTFLVIQMYFILILWNVTPFIMILIDRKKIDFLVQIFELK